MPPWLRGCQTAANADEHRSQFWLYRKLLIHMDSVAHNLHCFPQFRVVIGSWFPVLYSISCMWITCFSNPQCSYGYPFKSTEVIIDQLHVVKLSVFRIFAAAAIYLAPCNSAFVYRVGSWPLLQNQKTVRLWETFYWPKQDMGCFTTSFPFPKGDTQIIPFERFPLSYRA